METFFNTEFFRDLTTQFAGSILGVGGAVALFYWQIQHDKKKEAKKEQELENDKLIYLYVLVRKILSISKFYFDAFHNCGRELARQPVDKYQLSQTPKYDLKRLNEQLKIEEYFFAYVSRIGNDIKSVQNFRELIDNCELAALVIQEGIEKYSEFLKELDTLRSTFIDFFYESFENIEIASRSAEHWEDNRLSTMISVHSNNFINRGEGSYIEAAYKLFVYPTLSYLSTNTKYKNGAMGEIYNRLDKSDRTYTELTANGAATSVTMEEFADLMEDICSKLIDFSTELDSYLRGIDFKYPPLPKWQRPEDSNK
ncbi:MAG: hypothetical protein ACTHMM_16695 [Agriterribacter sp.]